MPGHALPSPRPVAGDLFAGAGGFSLGFHHGWHVAAAVELDPAASATYLVNLGDPATRIHTGPGLEKDAPLTDDGWTHARAAQALPDAGTGWISHRNPSTDQLETRPSSDEPTVEHFYRCDIRDLTARHDSRRLVREFPSISVMWLTSDLIQFEQ